MPGGGDWGGDGGCHMQKACLLPLGCSDRGAVRRRAPSVRVDLELKLQWPPAPFQSPGMGLGSKVTSTLYSSAMRMSR